MHLDGDIAATASAAATFSAVVYPAANDRLPAYLTRFGTGLVLPPSQGGEGGNRVSGAGIAEAHHAEVFGTGHVSPPQDTPTDNNQLPKLIALFLLLRYYFPEESELAASLVRELIYMLIHGEI